MHAQAGALLVENGEISEAQLQQALTTAVQYGGTLVQNLIRLGFIRDEDLAEFLAARLKLPMAGENQFENLPAFITKLVPSDIVIAHRLVPIMLHEGVLHVAMSDATDRAALEEIAFATGYRASAVVASPALVELAMARYYGIAPEDRSLPESVVVPPPENNVKVLAEAAARAAADEPDAAVGSGPPRAKPPLPPPPPPPKREETGAAVDGALDRAQAIAEAAARAVVATVTEEPAEPEQVAAVEDAPAEPAEAKTEHAAEREDVGLEQARQNLEVVIDGADELEELFFGLGREDAAVVHLTKRKPLGATGASGTIAEAIRSQTEAANGEQEGGAPSGIPGNEQPAQESGEVQPPLAEEDLRPLHHSETARIMLGEATDRDEVARILVRFALSHLPRISLFIVRKDILVGWMGAGEGLSSRRVKGIMIPLGSPSVFRTVRETGTDYFGSLPRTTVNDVFISAMGDVRPRQVLLIPITVRHKPICIMYGDCGKNTGFARDLSPVHLLVQDVSQAFERIILRRKMGRRIVR